MQDGSHRSIIAYIEPLPQICLTICLSIIYPYCICVSVCALVCLWFDVVTTMPPPLSPHCVQVNAAGQSVA